MRQFRFHLKGSKDVHHTPADSASYVRGFLVFKTNGIVTAQYPKEETQGWSEILAAETAADAGNHLTKRKPRRSNGPSGSE